MRNGKFYRLIIERNQQPPRQDFTEECHVQTSHKVKGPDQIVYFDKSGGDIRVKDAEMT